MAVSTDTIKALEQALPKTQVRLPGTEEYNALNEGYLSARESDIHPAVIIQPKTHSDVAKFVRTIAPFVESGAAKFAICGGGQQPTHACSNAEGGITLNLGLLNEVELNDGPSGSDKIVSIGAGARLGEVYNKLDGTGLGVSGVRNTRGGVGGLALSGGLSFFSTREGFVTDNVLNYKVVLASGEIVDANEKENRDLWVALRGGGNNFGIVVQYDFRTFPQDVLAGGSVYYFPPDFNGQVEALVAELTKPEPTKETHLMVSTGYADQMNGMSMCMNQVYYTGEHEHFKKEETDKIPAVLQPFVNMSTRLPGQTVETKSLKAAADEQASDARNRVRCQYINTTVKADVATIQAAAERYMASLENIKGKVKDLLCSCTLQPYPVSLLEKATDNSLGLSPASGPLVNILLLTYWKNKEDDELVLSTMRDTMQWIKADANERGTAVPYTFLAYADETQDPIGSYGDANKKALQEASKKYDPKGLFQKGVPGGFKLFKA